MPNYSGDGSGDTGGGSAQSQGGSGGWSGDGGAIGGGNANGNNIGYGGGAFSNENIGDTSIGSQYSAMDPTTAAPIDTGGWSTSDWNNWSEAGEADWNANTLAGVLRSVEENQDVPAMKMAIKAVVKFIGRLATGNIIGALGSLPDAVNAIAERVGSGETIEHSVKASLMDMGFSDDEINAAWDATEEADQSVSAMGDMSVNNGRLTGGGNAADIISEANANDMANLALETNTDGDQDGAATGNDTTGNTTSSIPDQFKDMFVGENPQFNIPELAQGYVDDVNSAFTDYTKQADDIAGSWQDFENRYSSIGASILDDYDGVRAKYEQNMESIPGLNIKLPGSMGGASIAMAPNAWGDFYSKQAGTSGALLDSKADSVPKFAGIESTSIANRQNLNQNRFANQTNTAQASRYPLDLANQLGSAEQQFKYGVTLNDSGKPDDPEWYESALPALAYAAGSGGLSDTYDAVQDFIDSW